MAMPVKGAPRRAFNKKREALGQMSLSFLNNHCCLFAAAAIKLAARHFAFAFQNLRSAFSADFHRLCGFCFNFFHVFLLCGIRALTSPLGINCKQGRERQSMTQIKVE
jgi:hypothetical protein